MKLAAILLVSASTLFITADDPPAPTPAAQPADAPKPDQPAARPGPRGNRAPADAQSLPGSVRQAMSLMDRSLKTLKTQVADTTKKEDNLKLVADMQRGCLGAKNLIPRTRGGRGGSGESGAQPAPDPKRLDTYRRQLLAMMRAALTLEEHILDGKTKEAEADLESIAKLREDSHDMFGVRE